MWQAVRSDCIEELEEDCPHCRAGEVSFFVFLGHLVLIMISLLGHRDIQAIGVRCNNVERGCGWEGTIGTLHCKNCGVLCPPNEQHTIGVISHRPLKVCLAHLIWCARS